MKNIISGAVLAAALFFAPSAFASDTIVAWGPSSNYVGGHTSGVGLSSGAVAFSDTVSRNPTIGNYPNSQSSGTFYGGAASTNASGLTVWRVSNGASGANDAITFAGQLGTGDTATALYVWKKEDFLASYDIRSAQATAFTTTLQHTGAGATLTGSARWVVKVADAYYVSAAFSTTTAAVQYTLSDPASVSWFSLNPATSLTAVGAQWATPDFSDISGVGIWWQLAATAPVTLAAGNVSEFVVTAIPEPSSAAFLVGGFIGGVALIARPRR